MLNHVKLRTNSAKRDVVERNLETTDICAPVKTIAGVEGLRGQNMKTAGILSNAIGGTVEVVEEVVAGDTEIKAGCSQTACGAEAVSHTGRSMAWSMMMNSEKSGLPLPWAEVPRHVH